MMRETLIGGGGSSDEEDDKNRWGQDEEEDDDAASMNSKVSMTEDWDKARMVPSAAEEQGVEDDAFYNFVLKSLKFLSFVVGFLVLLLGSIIAKVTLLLMTSQLKPNRFVRYCRGKTDNLEVGIGALERVTWSWAIAFCFMLPELLVLLRAARICLFKEIVWPTFAEFVIPFLFETAHTIGLSLLVFVVLPSMDAISALMLTNAVCLIPAVFGILTRLNNSLRARRNRAHARAGQGGSVGAMAMHMVNIGMGLGGDPAHAHANQGAPAWATPTDAGRKGARASREPTMDSDPFTFWSLTLVDFFVVLFVTCGLVIWPIFLSEPSEHAYLLPVACLLTSFRWWENYMISFTRRKEKVDDEDEEVRDPREDDRPKGSFNPLDWLSGVEFHCKSRYVVYLFISVWKCGLFISGMMLSYWIQDHEGGDVRLLFSRFTEAFDSHQINITEIRPFVVNNSLPAGSGSQMYDEYLIAFTKQSTPIYLMVAQMLAAFCAYLAGKFACKIGVQKFSFALPLTLTVPVAIAFLTSMCASRTENECFWEGVFPEYLFWTCPKGTVIDFMWKNYGWTWILWLLAQVWVTRHIWSPKFKRLERAEILFVTPYFDGLLVDQSLVLNRRREERALRAKLHVGDPGDDEDGDDDSAEAATRNRYQQLSFMDLYRGGGGEGDIDALAQYEADCIPKIYACATMWHEEPAEMMEMFKSIFRMDEDQCARRVARKYLGVSDPDYYEFETHIMFDDAFDRDKSPGWKKRPLRYNLNKYVKDMLNTIEKSAQHVHETNDLRLRAPKKIPTPYGGRLEYTLPGQTKLFIHLKNKDKIRHKKRWSQVMYMYYLLGFRLLAKEMPPERKDVIAENTFILALDGDIDFKPFAVRLLVDLMKKNKDLGAACGRIHPVGSPSLMVWYQKFEYAIGHWFQKATEHVIGCVLCSPGCFSLFRATALLDTNVMATYTTEPSEAKHFIQYDQGEDRWLCTLLLQRGYRIEYSAASDSWTHCPEEFDVFFNQRRRWAPSTMANIIDLLSTSKTTIRNNDNISYPYIIYQTALMIGSILGPGTIFLMLIGAFNAAFRIDNTTALIWNTVPVLLFILVCFFFDKRIQLLVAQILAAIYALVMVAVVVALLMQIREDGVLAPSSLFFFGVAASFITAALLHPLEFGCLPHGIVYYITIPTMYMILIIYSLMNLNDVSWGTRESVEVDDGEEDAADKKKEAAEKAAGATHAGASPQGDPGFFANLFTKTRAAADSEGSFEFNCAGLFKLMCCTKPITDDRIQLQRIADSLSHVSSRLDNMEHHRGAFGGGPGSGVDRRSSVNSNAPPRSSLTGDSGVGLETVPEAEEGETGPRSLASAGGGGPPKPTENANSPPKIEVEPVDEDVYPKWAEDPGLAGATMDFLTLVEGTFWTKLITKYLTPAKDAKDPEFIKEKAANEKLLLDLRNTMVFFFLMINAVFIVAIFLLQNNKETIFIEWPFDAKYNMTYVAGTTDIELHKESLALEPIGIVFVFVFALVMAIQFISMLGHRIATFLHIMASVALSICGLSSGDTSSPSKEKEANADLDKQGMAVAKKAVKLKDPNAPGAEGGVKGDAKRRRTTTTDIGRRKTVSNLEKTHENVGARKAIVNLEQMAKQKINTARRSVDGRNNSGIFGDGISRSTLQALDHRRMTVVANDNQRRSSVMGGGPNRSSFSGGGGGGRSSLSGGGGGANRLSFTSPSPTGPSARRSSKRISHVGFAN